MFDIHILPQKEFNIPVISVGNITVGGTGKTPHVEYIINLLKDEFRLAVLSRGYKRKTKGFIIADNYSSPNEIGDEPCQIHNKFPEIQVAVDANRVNGIQNLLNSGQVIDVIVLDDAFQHRYVKPGLSLLLIDYERPISKDALLPFGRLREPASSKKRADIILVTKSPEELKAIERRIIVKNLNLPYFQHLYFTSVVREKIQSVFSELPCPEIEKLIERKPAILLLCGIANPTNVKNFTRNISANIIEMFFPDHHVYTRKDIIRISEVYSKIPETDKIIITTEKDSVRLRGIQDVPEEIRKNMFFIPIKIKFLNDDEENFNKQIFAYVRNNKRNSILYK